MNTGTSGGGWRSLKTVVAEHNDCHGEDEEVGWEHKLKSTLVSIIHTIIETQRESKVKVHK